MQLEIIVISSDSGEDELNSARPSQVLVSSDDSLAATCGDNELHQGVMIDSRSVIVTNVLLSSMGTPEDLADMHDIISEMRVRASYRSFRILV